MSRQTLEQQPLLLPLLLLSLLSEANSFSLINPNTLPVLPHPSTETGQALLVSRLPPHLSAKEIASRSNLSNEASNVVADGVLSKQHSTTPAKRAGSLAGDSDCGVTATTLGVTSVATASTKVAGFTSLEPPSASSTPTADAVEIENAFMGVVAAVTKAMTEPLIDRRSVDSGDKSNGGVEVALWPHHTPPKEVQEARVAFFSKVSKVFGLKSTEDANGVVYIHRGSGGAKLMVDRNRLLRLRGDQQKGEWSMHFLGTGSMQASVGCCWPCRW